MILIEEQASLPLHYVIKAGKIAEERRLFYVAVTRARKRVYVLHAPYHHAPSGQTFSEPSRFITSAVEATLLLNNVTPTLEKFRQTRS